MSEESQIPLAFTHSIKISDTAKGVRFDVHVYANDGQTAISEAFKLYEGAKVEAEARKIPLAPIEIKEAKA